MIYFVDFKNKKIHCIKDNQGNNYIVVTSKSQQEKSRKRHNDRVMDNLRKKKEKTS